MKSHPFYFYWLKLAADFFYSLQQKEPQLMKFINICMEKCYETQMFVFLQDLYAESLTSDTLVFVDSTFESELGYKDRVFTNGISALVKRDECF